MVSGGLGGGGLVGSLGDDWGVRPLPLAPGGCVRVGPGVEVLVDADGAGSVFLWGMAAWCWAPGDDAAKRLAAVGLVTSVGVRKRRVAEVFGINDTTLWRWRSDYDTGGVAGLVSEPKGPKGPWKLTGETEAEIVLLRRQGLSLREVAKRTSVSTDTVRRVLAAATPEPDPAPDADPASEPDPGGLVPLARPEARDGERQAARRGELVEAAPRICEGASLPLAGALVILPALVATGLLDAVAAVFRPARAAFYGIRSLVLTLVFAALVGEPRVEGLTRLNPVDLGRLLGLDRAPEVRCLRSRIAALADQGRSGALLDALARHHIETNTEAAGIFYVDGHVRAYHGQADVPKAHVARMRLSMPAEVDTWIADARGDGVLVWQGPPGASLVGELARATAEIRDLVGVDARPLIIFDRGGWSPAAFVRLDAAGFDIATYRKAPKTPEPRAAFVEHRFVDDMGRVRHWWLADRPVRLSWDRGRRRFPARQITRLDVASGHQTQIITTRADTDPAGLAHAMFSRWRQENFFRYMRHHYGLDALDSYTTTGDDPTRMVPNPARRDADRQLRQARADLEAAHATEHQATCHQPRNPPDTATIAAAFDAATAEVAELETAASAIAAKIALGEARPDATRLDPERKRIHDAIRMATYNAETALARLLAPHYRRANHEARTLLHEIFSTPADLHIDGNQLHVTINPLSAPRRTRALTALCNDLTATQTTYPGTNLTLTYTTKTPT